MLSVSHKSSRIGMICSEKIISEMCSMKVIYQLSLKERQEKYFEMIESARGKRPQYVEEIGNKNQ